MALAPLVFDINFTVPVEELWANWTEEPQLARWLTGKARVELRPGGAFEFSWERDGVQAQELLGGAILALEEEYEIRFSWRAPQRFATLMNSPPASTSVVVRFQPLGPAKSRLHLEHIGWGEDATWSEARTWHEEAWKDALGRLQALLGPH